VVDASRVPFVGNGTGFLISPSLLLTNQHVLSSTALAAVSELQLDEEGDVAGGVRPGRVVGLAPDRLFLANPALDYCVVALEELGLGHDYGFLRLLLDAGKIAAGDLVSIIQHPNGEPKQLALRANHVVDVRPDHVYYRTDTAAGSSGAPVLNEQWQVVALHSSGMPATRDGRWLAVDDQLWEPAMGEHRVRWIVNEGIRVSRIAADLRNALARGSAEEQALLAEVFSTPRASVPTESGHASASGAPADALEGRARRAEDYADRSGYAVDFLGRGFEVPLPGLGGWERHVAPLLTEDGHELRYANFSVVMSGARRLPLFTAVNIRGRDLLSLPRSGETWSYDPRLDRALQVGNEVYDQNPLDRGHMVRRRDAVWGLHAATANRDTFHYTNACPQHKWLNQRTWNDLENYILDNAQVRGLCVSVFTGPVLREDDPAYRGVQIPREFWKIAVLVDAETGALASSGYLRSQENLFDDLLEFAFSSFRTYQVPIAYLEQLTGLEFSVLAEADALASPSGQESPLKPRLIEGPGDIQLRPGVADFA